MNEHGVIVQSVDRAMNIVGCFTGTTTELGISEIAERMSLSKSTIYGLVNTLAAGGFLEQIPDSKKYRLGIRLFELGNLVGKRMDLRREAEPFCRMLAEKHRQTVHLAALVGTEIVYVDKVDNPEISIAYSYIGKRAQMYCTGVGKAVLAHMREDEIERYLATEPLKAFTANTITSPQRLLEELQRIRGRGYAIDNEEIEDGLKCVAAPIMNHKGLPIGAISSSGMASKMQEHQIVQMIQDVCYFASCISARFGYGTA